MSALVACGGGGGSSSSATNNQFTLLNMAVSSDIKQLQFSWTPVQGATYYQLLENPDGHSGYTQVGADIMAPATAVALDISVHRHDWANALFQLQACNTSGCRISSNEVSTLDQMLKTIGFFKASNVDQDDMFGYALALSADGNTLAVGAMAEDSDATGIPALALKSGAVYIFVRESGVWSQQAMLKASVVDVYDGFGWAVALSADGNTLAVGAPQEDSNANVVNGVATNNNASDAGAAYVFTRTGSDWNQQAYVKAHNSEANDKFGWAVALSGDGNTLAVGAPGDDSDAVGINGDGLNNNAAEAGSVRVFTRAGDTWTHQAYLKPLNPGAGDQFGWAVALNDNGDTLVVGAPREDSAGSGINNDTPGPFDDTANSSGAAYVFAHPGTVWSQTAFLKPFNTVAGFSFGTSVAVSADGYLFAVGAPGESSNAVGVGGDQTDHSMSGSGAVYLFHHLVIQIPQQPPLESWFQEAYVKPSNTEQGDKFGSTVALSADGTSLAVEAPLEASDAIGIDGDQANNLATASGAVYQFENSSGSWTQRSYIKAPYSSNNLNFGGVGVGGSSIADVFTTALALNGDGSVLAVGVPLESTDTVGINPGDMTNNNHSYNSGAVFLY